MLNRLKKAFYSEDLKNSEKDKDNLNEEPINIESESESDSIDIFDSGTGIDITTENKKSKYKVIRTEGESADVLSNVSCICAKCGDDQSEFIMGGETEVFSVKLRKSIDSDSRESVENSNDTSGSLDSVNSQNRSQNRSMTILSPEKLCLKCEISEHPERFHGCAFCRRPLRNIFACSTCRIGFAEWIKEAIHPDTMILSGIRKQAQKIVSGIIESGYIENREFLQREDQMMFEWPGFYVGMSNLTDKGESQYYLPTWIIPECLTVKEKSKSLSVSKDLTLKKIANFEMFENKLLSILEENGIHLYSNVQIDLSVFDRSNIREINPYDTSILK